MADREVLVDIDGTVALKGDRFPFDYSRVHEDAPNAPVIAAVRAFHAAGASTAAWLRKHVGVAFDGLFMRPAKDYRPDAVVKAEL